MVTISEKKLNEFFDNFKSKKIIVLGDLMLDRYVEGSVSRISPEAPVPVVEVNSEFVRLGGAANVAYNLYSLGAQPITIGVVGDDFAGRELLNLMRQFGFDTEFIFADQNRPTVVKTRIIANNQHVVRADWESKEFIQNHLKEKIIAAVQQNLKEADALIFEDYNKGLLSKDIIKTVIRLARETESIITVDPKFDNFFEYRSVTLFKPNRKELESALGTRIKSDQDLERACKELIERLHSEFLLVTLGENGMCLLNRAGDFLRIPTKARKVHDVSGAGDTVISTLTMALASGSSIPEAITLANYAAGAVCEEVGVVPITQEKLKRALRNYRSSKIDKFSPSAQKR